MPEQQQLKSTPSAAKTTFKIRFPTNLRATFRAEEGSKKKAVSVQNMASFLQALWSPSGNGTFSLSDSVWSALMAAVICWVLSRIILLNTAILTGKDRLAVFSGPFGVTEPRVHYAAEGMQRRQWNAGQILAVPAADLLVTSSGSSSYLFARKYLGSGLWASTVHGHESVSAPRKIWPTGKATDVSKFVYASKTCRYPPLMDFTPSAMTLLDELTDQNVLAVVAHSRPNYPHSRHAVELFNVTGRGDDAYLTWIGCITLPEGDYGTAIDFYNTKNKLNLVLGVDSFSLYSVEGAVDPFSVALHSYLTGVEHYIGHVDPHRNSILFSVTRLFHHFSLVAETLREYASRFMSWTGFQRTGKIYQLLQNEEMFNWTRSTEDEFTVSLHSNSVRRLQGKDEAGSVHWYTYYIDHNRNRICRRMDGEECVSVFPKGEWIQAFTVWPGKQLVIVLTSEASHFDMEFCIANGATSCPYPWKLYAVSLDDLTDVDELFSSSADEDDVKIFGAPTNLVLYQKSAQNAPILFVTSRVGNSVVSLQLPSLY